MKTYQSACSLDCWDACSMLVSVEDGSKVRVSGDPGDPITQGFLCGKGQRIVERFAHPDRLTSPMKRTVSGWKSISWDEALDDIADQLSSIISQYGPASLIHYSEGGHGGLAKNIDTAFFNALGATTPVGSLCLGAGMAAQKLDFGNAYCHSPEDLLNARCLILWGRNPAETNIHLVPFIRRLKKQGIPVYLIDPVHSASVSLADEHLALLPGSDGHLALAMAKYLAEHNLLDNSFVEQHCLFADDYFRMLNTFSYDELISATGLLPEQVFRLSETYGRSSPGSIYLGYGIQRNRYGGRSIRFIDALGALTGNIGIAGGGVNYAHRHISRWIDTEYLENTPSVSGPTFPRAHFPTFVTMQPENAVQGIFVSKANPVLQLPDTNQTLQAFQQIPFKVVIDHFMTDTAQLADYVLPCTMILEESDVIFSSMWHNRMTWTERAIDPPEGVKHEFQIFYGLAQRMGMQDFILKYPDLNTYLETSMAPLCQYLNTTPASLKGKRVAVPGNELPWHNRQFETPSGRFVFLVPNLEELLPSQQDPAFPYPLLTVHAAESLHSQHLRTRSAEVIPDVLMSPSTAQIAQLQNGDEAVLVSQSGSLRCRVCIDPLQQPNLLVMKQGTWLKNGAANQLTSQKLTDIGLQAAYYDCFCRLEQA
ncbi:MAG: molybdopterin-dependent oxidoreductase [Bacillota bacterium]|nr:molybdopterin-dependent oxidoreductase [Bacillota bacterium]MDW7676253.1 molybdopterin-dependent oxidoreductase [Bacillota bacterium]